MWLCKLYGLELGRSKGIEALKVVSDAQTLSQCHLPSVAPRTSLKLE